MKRRELFGVAVGAAVLATTAKATTPTMQEAPPVDDGPSSKVSIKETRQTYLLALLDAPDDFDRTPAWADMCELFKAFEQDAAKTRLGIKMAVPFIEAENKATGARLLPQSIAFPINTMADLKKGDLFVLEEEDGGVLVNYEDTVIFKATSDGYLLDDGVPCVQADSYPDKYRRHMMRVL